MKEYMYKVCYNDLDNGMFKEHEYFIDFKDAFNFAKKVKGTIFYKEETNINGFTFVWRRVKGGAKQWQ